ncbi:hypothetical protein [Streptomyces sp. 6N223]|uniref:hypothetical protein n=1 Tax=Streptomyces sp. 6N223 TaxID=3457412 RepID=UPI003FD3A871
MSAGAALLLTACGGGGGDDEAGGDPSELPSRLSDLNAGTPGPTSTASSPASSPTPTTAEPTTPPPPDPTTAAPTEEPTRDHSLMDELDGVWQTAPVPGEGGQLTFDGSAEVTYIPQDTTDYLLCIGELDGDTISLDCPDALDPSQLPYHLDATLTLNGSTLAVDWGDETETYTYYGPGRY